jgi:PII-like signaling protein
MNKLDVVFVRIYLTESEGIMEDLLRRLHDEEKVQGVTVFRGLSGFGKSGKMHSSSLLDMSLNLPLVVEFFDTPQKVDAILEHISKDMEPGHIVSWPASLAV